MAADSTSYCDCRLHTDGIQCCLVLRGTAHWTAYRSTTSAFVAIDKLTALHDNYNSSFCCDWTCVTTWRKPWRRWTEKNVASSYGKIFATNHETGQQQTRRFQCVSQIQPLSDPDFFKMLFFPLFFYFSFFCSFVYFIYFIFSFSSFLVYFPFPFFLCLFSFVFSLFFLLFVFLFCFFDFYFSSVF